MTREALNFGSTSVNPLQRATLYTPRELGYLEGPFVTSAHSTTTHREDEPMYRKPWCKKNTEASVCRRLSSNLICKRLRNRRFKFLYDKNKIH